MLKNVSLFLLVSFFVLICQGGWTARQGSAVAASPGSTIVADKDGKPLADVRVYYHLRPRIAVPSEVKETSPVLTSAAGSFSLPPNSLPGALVVFAKNGYATRAFSSDEPLPSTVSLQPGGRILGIVLTDTGTTVTDGQIGPLQPAGVSSLAGEKTHPLLFAKTDRKGLFEIDGLDRGRYEFAVTSGAGAARSATATTDLPTTIILSTRGTTVTGVVRGSRDLLPKPAEYVLAAAASTSIYVRTGDNGRFSFGMLPTQPWTLRVVDPENPSVIHPAEHINLKPSVEDTHVDLRLNQPRRIAGVAINAETSEPVGGLQVKLSTDPPQSAMTDPQGAFNFNSVDGFGDLSIRLETPQYTIVSQGNGSYDYLTIPDSNGQDITTITLALTSRPTISGKVVDGSGTALRGASVQIVSKDGNLVRVGKQLKPAEFTALSTTDGSFKASVYPPGSYDVTASSANLVSETMAVEAYTTSPVNVRLQLQAATDLTGVVLDANDKPVTAAQVKIYPDVLRNEDAPEPRPLKTAIGGNAGEFSVKGMRPQSYRLTASHPDFAVPAETTFKLDAIAATTATLKFRAGNDFSGVVLDPNGKPVSDVEVRIYYDDGPWHQALVRTSDQNGRVRARGLSVSSLKSITVDALEYMSFKAESVQLPQTDYPIQLKQRGSIVVTIEDPQNIVEPRPAVSLLYTSGNAAGSADSAGIPLANSFVTHGQVTPKENKATFKNLEVGWYKVAVQRGAQSIESDPVKLTDSEVKQMSVVLQNGSVQGRITDKATRQPVQGAVVSVGTASQGLTAAEPAKAVTGADGSYSIPTAPVGMAVLRVSHSSYPEYERPLKVGQGTEANVALSAETARLKGSVTYTGAPVSGALLVAYKADHPDVPVANASSDASGKFEMQGIPAGAYTVTVEAAIGKGDESSHRSYDVKVAPPETNLDVQFVKPTTVKGRVKLPNGVKASSLLFTPRGGTGAGGTATITNGSYEIQLDPGTYSVGIEDQPGKDHDVPPSDSPFLLNLEF